MWCSMPGFVCVMEALMRDKFCPTESVTYTIGEAFGHLIRPCTSQDPMTLTACISMAATIHKLVTRCLRPASDVPNQPCMSAAKLDPVLLDLLTTVVDGFGMLVNLLHQAMQAQDSCSSSSGGSKDSSHASTGRNRSRFSMRKAPRVAWQAKDGSRSCNIDSGVVSPGSQSGPFPAHTLHQLQLQSILLSCLVQLCHWRVRGTNRADTMHPADLSRWLESICGSYKHLGFGLPGLMQELLSVWLMHMPNARAKVGEIWGVYALKFHGRLLPGCCHLGCTNMAGVSEAALPTLLCGGCRRARYCSKECQRAAWAQGGHGSVCRK